MASLLPISTNRGISTNYNGKVIDTRLDNTLHGPAACATQMDAELASPLSLAWPRQAPLMRKLGHCPSAHGANEQKATY